MSGPKASARASHLVLADRYELVRHIARGGMADVFEATDRQLGRQVAVKRFRGGSPQDRPRFDAEVLVLARLNHPNLVQVYDAGEHDGDGFVVMELIDGPSLAQILQTRVALPDHELADLAVPLADALAYVHANDVVHRDVTGRGSPTSASPAWWTRRASPPSPRRWGQRRTWHLSRSRATPRVRPPTSTPSGWSCSRR
jgi:serine/threonine protein kinase